MNKALCQRSIFRQSNLPYAIVCLLICTAQHAVLMSQQSLFLSGAREAGLASTAVAVTGNWSMYHNPAGMSGNTCTTVGIHYTNQYMLPELSVASAMGIMPINQGAFGFSASYFGSTRYNEQKYALGYAHKLGKKLHAGILIDYFTVHLPGEYEDARIIAGEIGILMYPADNFSVGCHLNNPTGSKYNKYSSENVPSYFALGVAWTSDVFLISSQMNLNKLSEPTYSIASEVFIVSNLAARIGISTNRMSQYTVGLGYRNNKIEGDIAFARHPVLGFSSIVSFTILMGNKKE